MKLSTYVADRSVRPQGSGFESRSRQLFFPLSKKTNRHNYVAPIAGNVHPAPDLTDVRRHTTQIFKRVFSVRTSEGNCGVLSMGYGHGGPSVCLDDGQTEVEGVPSQGGRGDALLPPRMSPYLT